MKSVDLIAAIADHLDVPFPTLESRVRHWRSASGLTLKRGRGAADLTREAAVDILAAICVADRRLMSDHDLRTQARDRAERAYDHGAAFSVGPYGAFAETRTCPESVVRLAAECVAQSA